MKSGIWQLAGISVLCLGIGAQAQAAESGQDANRDALRGSNSNGVREQQNQMRQLDRQQRQQVQQQQNYQRSVEQQQQQQINQQQRQQQQQIQQQNNYQRQVERQQQQQINQLQRNQQRQIQEQNTYQRNVEQQQQQQQMQEERNRRRQQDNEQRQRQNELRQSQERLPIQSGPGQAWQTQPPRQGYYRDIPRGNGWGPGPQYRPGHRVERFAGDYSRIPWRGQDYYFSDGYWYRPQGSQYVVVTPPYGVRVRSLPSYSQQMWVGGSLLFLAAGTYYAYQNDSQDYVVVNPPQQPVYEQPPQQGNGYDPVAYPVNGQSAEQVQLDQYQCYRWAVDQSGFDPDNTTYAPQPQVVDLYRRSMGACLAERGYRVSYPAL